MSDRELEQWLRDQVPDGPSAALDARVIAAGRRALAGRRQRRAGAAAAALILVGLAALSLGRDRIAGDALRTAHAAQRIDVAEHGYFELGVGSRFAHATPAPRLRLELGTVEVHAVHAPLVVELPGDARFHIERGVGSVRIFEQEERDVSQANQQEQTLRQNRSWPRKSLVVVLSLAALGIGWVELQHEVLQVDGGSEHKFIAIEGLGAKTRLVASTATNSSPVAQPLRVNPDTEAADASPRPENDSALVRGRVIDGVTNAAIEGAKVAWVRHWDESRVGMLTLRSASRRMIRGVAAKDLTVELDGSRVDLTGIVPAREGPRTEIVAESECDADGMFTLPPQAQPGDFLRARASGYALGRFPFGPEQVAAADSPPIELQLTPECVVRVDLAPIDGAPLKGGGTFTFAEFTTPLGVADWTVSWDMRPEPNGAFELVIGEPAELALKIWAQGYADATASVRARPGETRLTIPLEQHAHVYGHVTNAAGDPVPRVAIHVISTKRGLFGSSENHVSSTTNAEGFYLANTYAPEVTIALQADGFVPISQVVKPDGNALDFVLESADACSLSGRVVDEFAEPLAGVDLRMINDGPGLIRAYRGVSDESGEFDVSDMPPGAYTLSAEIRFAMELDPTSGESRRAPLPEHVVHVPVRMQQIRLENGEQRVGVEVRLPAGGRITGRYRGADGALGAYEWIALYRPAVLGGSHELLASTRTSADGGFEFLSVPSGTLAVATSDAEGKYRLLTMHGAETHVVEFGSAPASVTGVVRREGQAITTAAFALGRVVEGELADTRLGSLDADGRFKASDLPWGLYLLHISDPTTGTAMLRRFDLDRAQFDLELAWPRSVVTIKVQGAPVAAGTRVRLTLVAIDELRLEGVVPPGHLAIASATSADGRTFTLGGVARGRYRVQIDGASSNVELTVDDENAEMVVEVPNP
ncbi:MAG: hypothetical protein ACKVX7_18960 [Planctomycetota bacterium]